MSHRTMPARIAMAVLAAASLPASAASIVVTRGDDGAPIVEYVLDAPAQIRFDDREPATHDVVRTAFWHPVDTCGSLTVDGIDAPADCRPRYRLDWDGEPRDRMYPALVRLQSGGVLIYTGNLAATIGAAPLDWEVRAPAGGIASFRGETSRDSIRIDGRTFADDARGWIYLGPDRFASTSTANVLVDDGVPPTLTRVIDEVGGDLIALFADRLGRPLETKPSFYLEWNGRDRPKRDLQFDVVPGNVIRFGLHGSGWSETKPADADMLRAFAAHEIAHYWNNGAFRPQADEAPWLHEGNAELLSAASLAQRRLVAPDAAVERIDTALNACLMAAGNASWTTMRDRDAGQTPYACGMALHVAIVAAARRSDPALDAFGVWKQLWAKHPRYSVRDLSIVGSDGVDRLPPLLTGDRPLRAALIDAYTAAGIAVSEGGALPPDQKMRLGRELVLALMQIDCDGGYGFAGRDDHFVLDDLKTCRTLRGAFALRYVAGIDVIIDPQAALEQARQACASGGPVVVEDVARAAAKVACTAESALPAAYVPLRLAPEAVRGVLGVAAP